MRCNQQEELVTGSYKHSFLPDLSVVVDARSAFGAIEDVIVIDVVVTLVIKYFLLWIQQAAFCCFSEVDFALVMDNRMCSMTACAQESLTMVKIYIMIKLMVSFTLI